jgi:Mce-associated membrane protein
MSDSDEPTVPAPETVASPAAPADPGTGARRGLLVVVAAVVVLLVLAGAGVATFLVLRGGDDKAPLVDPEVLVTARQEAVNFFTLDYRKAGEDADKVLALATGTFKDQYQANKAALVQQLAAKKLITTGTIPADGAAVEFVHGDHAQVLVVIDVARTNALKAGASDSLRNRARVLLTEVRGHWLVSGVNQVG